ncbi:MAG: hypothetical protein K8T20_09985 [Planctomycetes bacterium]|nr:hypothetical protein [Planctomycetota bacterium]
MTELESTFFELLDPREPGVAALGEALLHELARQLAEPARDAVSGVIGLADCDVAMRRILYGGGYPRGLAKGAARRLVDHVA